MRDSLRHLAVAFAVGLCGLGLAAPAEAQVCIYPPVYPNGCSVPFSPEWVMRGLDGIFLGACDFHDSCWADCNGEFPPYHGVGHKLACDALFLGYLEAACAFWAPQIAYPLDDIMDIEDFLEVCNGIVAPVMYGAVSSPWSYPIYWDNQCCNGCNPSACANIGMQLPWTCGQPPGFGRKFCYWSWNFPTCGDGYCDAGEDCWSCSDCCGGGGGGGGGGEGGGGGGGCDPDGDGWVTEWECMWDCGGYVDGPFCMVGWAN